MYSNRPFLRCFYIIVHALTFSSEFHHRSVGGEVEEEFELLSEFSSELYETKARRIGQLDINKPKNRFVDIVPCKSRCYVSDLPH